MTNPWILAARPKTLPACVVPVWVGAVLAWRLEGKVELWLTFCTLAGALAIQVAVNFFNDALDFKKGADTAARLGPVRVTASGLVTPRQVLLMGAGVLGVACLFSLPLIQARGWPMLVIGVPSLYFSYGYTGGPVPLAYRGLGELFVLLFFGLVAVAGTVFVITGHWLGEAVLAGFQAGLLSTVLIAINNLRDVAEDAGTGKRTLAVRLGAGFARWEITALCVLPHVLGVVWWGWCGWWAGAVLPLLALPLGLRIAAGVWRTEPWREYNKFLAMAGGQLLVWAGLLTVAALL